MKISAIAMVLAFVGSAGTGIAIEPAKTETPIVIAETAASDQDTPILENTPVPANTPIPENTPIPQNTPVPANTPIPENTPIPQNTPIASTVVASATPVPGAAQLNAGTKSLPAQAGSRKVPAKPKLSARQQRLFDEKIARLKARTPQTDSAKP